MDWGVAVELENPDPKSLTAIEGPRHLCSSQIFIKGELLYGWKWQGFDFEHNEKWNKMEKYAESKNATKRKIEKSNKMKKQKEEKMKCTP